MMLIEKLFTLYLHARQSNGKDGSGAGRSSIRGATALADGSVVLGGSTEGDWNTTNKGLKDFAAVKLDIGGVEEWRYQVRRCWTVLVFPLAD